MVPLVAGILWFGVAVIALLLPFFYVCSSASKSAKLLSFVVLCGATAYYQYFHPANTLLAELNAYASSYPYKTLAIMLAIAIPLGRAQQQLRFARVDHLMKKYGFTDDPKSFGNMTMEVAQEVEANMAEYEFPRLYQFAWISDFLRLTSTDPGVSRALIRSGHMVNPDPMIEHERLQATIALMGAFMAYPLKSKMHSLVVARINEHHHRYGVWINSDDILYLIIHFAVIPGHWINRFGYRKLEAFEEHALWVLWREIGCMMGCRYMPQELSQAKEWRKNFEQKCRWPCSENEEAGMAMLNEIVYTCPSLLKPFLRKVVVSILDWDIVFYCQMDKLGRSQILRFFMFRAFDLCGWFILHFGLPRLSPYKRTFEESKRKPGVVHIVPTPYDTLPFYQARTFWNLWGYGAIIRSVLGLPAPSPVFYSDGVTIEAMGAVQTSHESQITVEKKVREKATILEKSPAGFRPAIAYQANRLLAPINGPEYGLATNRYPKGTVVIPAGNNLRFDKKWEQRIAGYSKVDVMEKPEDIIHFDAQEAYGGTVDAIGVSIPLVNFPPA